VILWCRGDLAPRTTAVQSHHARSNVSGSTAGSSFVARYMFVSHHSHTRTALSITTSNARSLPASPSRSRPKKGRMLPVSMASRCSSSGSYHCKIATSNILLQRQTNSGHKPFVCTPYVQAGRPYLPIQQAYLGHPLCRPP
jgi:hypothetical protein